MNVMRRRTTPPRLLQLLNDAQSTMVRLFEHRAHHLGITRPQWRVIAGLYGNNGMTQTELSQLTDIARSPLGKIIDQLEKKNFIERKGDPDDRRINRLYLTESVEPILEPARALVHELEAEAVAGIEPLADPVETIRALSVRLKQMLEQEFQPSSLSQTLDGAAATNR